MIRMRNGGKSRQLLDAAVSYFRQHRRGYERLFQELCKKYRSLGHFGGVITLSQLTAEEADVLTGLLQRFCEPQSTVRFAAKEVERWFAQTRFAETGLKALLEAYFGQPLRSKKAEREEQANQWRSFWQEMQKKLAELERERTTGIFAWEARRSWEQTSAKSDIARAAGAKVAEETRHLCQEWFTALERGEAPGYQSVRQWFAHSPEQLEKSLLLVIRAVMRIRSLAPPQYVRLPVLSASVTGDPHAFDQDRALGKLLLHALCYLCQSEVPTNAEEVAALLYEQRVLRDDLSSAVVCCGLQTETACYREVIGLPLRTVVRMRQFTPLLANRTKRVWVVENPAVFSAILDRWEAEYPSFAASFALTPASGAIRADGTADPPWPPLVCSSGQFTLAVLALCDRLAASGCEIWYSGDLDPKGVQIAMRLWERYPAGTVVFWRYTARDYLQSLSENAIIKENDKQWSHLKKYLRSKLVLPAEIRETVQLMIEQKKPAYQEAFYGRLYEDIRDHLCFSHV